MCTLTAFSHKLGSSNARSTDPTMRTTTASSCALGSSNAKSTDPITRTTTASSCALGSSNARSIDPTTRTTIASSRALGSSNARSTGPTAHTSPHPTARLAAAMQEAQALRRAHSAAAPQEAQAHTHHIQPRTQQQQGTCGLCSPCCLAGRCLRSRGRLRGVGTYGSLA
eukprot:975572-Pelagomonas_calceolata.AAC.2